MKVAERNFTDIWQSDMCKNNRDSVDLFTFIGKEACKYFYTFNEILAKPNKRAHANEKVFHGYFEGK